MEEIMYMCQSVGWIAWFTTDMWSFSGELSRHYSIHVPGKFEMWNWTIQSGQIGNLTKGQSELEVSCDVDVMTICRLRSTNMSQAFVFSQKGSNFSDPNLPFIQKLYKHYGNIKVKKITSFKLRNWLFILISFFHFWNVIMLLCVSLFLLYFYISVLEYLCTSVLGGRREEGTHHQLALVAHL